MRRRSARRSIVADLRSRRPEAVSHPPHVFHSLPAHPDLTNAITGLTVRLLDEGVHIYMDDLVDRHDLLNCTVAAFFQTAGFTIQKAPADTPSHVQLRARHLEGWVRGDVTFNIYFRRHGKQLDGRVDAEIQSGPRSDLMERLAEFPRTADAPVGDGLADLVDLEDVPGAVRAYLTVLGPALARLIGRGITE